jgi:hypothetical protein
MNGTQTPPGRIARVHRNLESLATVATPATALRGLVYSRCHPIKKVATTGNTHISFNIRDWLKPSFWLSLLPVKNRWQQNSQLGNGWRPRIPWVLPLLPLLPVVLKSQEHVYVCNSGEVVQ